MKIIARTLAILALALLVAGVTFGLAQTSYAQSLFPSRGRPSAAAQATAGGATDASAPQFERGHGEGGHGASLFGLAEVVKDLVIIGVITGAVSLVKRLLPKRGPRSRANHPTAPPAAPSSV